MKNAISWFQIPVLDIERSTKFYGTILSVEFAITEIMSAKVAIFPYDHESGNVGGALYCGQSYVPGIHGSLVFLNAGNDLSVVLEKVEEAGGSILMTKTAINNNNDFIAYITDSEGNRVGLHSNF